MTVKATGLDWSSDISSADNVSEYWGYMIHELRAIDLSSYEDKTGS